MSSKSQCYVTCYMFSRIHLQMSCHILRGCMHFQKHGKSGMRVWTYYRHDVIRSDGGQSICKNQSALFRTTCEINVKSSEQAVNSPTGFPRRPPSLSCMRIVCFSSCPFSSTCVSYLVFHSFSDDVTNYSVQTNI